MKPIMKTMITQLLVTLTFLSFTIAALAKSRAKINTRTKANVEATKFKGKWIRDKFSTLQSHGLSVEDANQCESFEVEVLEKNIIYKIRCGKHFSSGLLPLGLEKDYKVERKGNEITVTKLNYYGQKVQTSNTAQNLIRNPFVEEVTFVKILQDGTLAFYKESFSVDDFGRVVQKSFLQGYGLTSASDRKVGKR